MSNLITHGQHQLCQFKKKNGSYRFCIYYRKFNSNINKDAYPLPRFGGSLDQQNGSSWISTLDLCSEYWQIEMDQEDKPKTAFASRRGLFQFNVMPFGLCCVPATFERLMESRPSLGHMSRLFRRHYCGR